MLPKPYQTRLITILITIITNFMGIFSGKASDQKIKQEFINEKKEFAEGKEADGSFLSIPISSSQEQNSNWISFDQKSDSNNNFLYFNNSSTVSDNTSEISPAMYDLIHKLELAVKSGKIDNETIELFNQANKLCTLDQISKISPTINASTLQIFLERSKDLSKENIVEQTLDKNLSPDIKNNYSEDFKDFIRTRQNPFEAQQDLIENTLLNNSNDKNKNNKT